MLHKTYIEDHLLFGAYISRFSLYMCMSSRTSLRDQNHTTVDKSLLGIEGGEIVLETNILSLMISDSSWLTMHCSSSLVEIYNNQRVTPFLACRITCKSRARAVASFGGQTLMQPLHLNHLYITTY